MKVNTVRLGNSYDIFIDNNIVGNYYIRNGEWMIKFHSLVSIDEIKKILPLLESIKDESK